MDGLKEKIEDFQDKIAETTREFGEKILHFLIFPILAVSLLFFIIYAWYEAAQKLCDYWFTKDLIANKEERWRCIESSIVFAIFTTIFLTLLIWVCRPHVLDPQIHPHTKI